MYKINIGKNCYVFIFFLTNSGTSIMQKQRVSHGQRIRYAAKVGIGAADTPDFVSYGEQLNKMIFLAAERNGQYEAGESPTPQNHGPAE
jgi:hypothetical protein